MATPTTTAQTRLTDGRFDTADADQSTAPDKTYSVKDGGLNGEKQVYTARAVATVLTDYADAVSGCEQTGFNDALGDLGPQGAAKREQLPESVTGGRIARDVNQSPARAYVDAPENGTQEVRVTIFATDRKHTYRKRYRFEIDTDRVQFGDSDDW